MDSKLRNDSERFYILLSGLFIAALVVCNLIANKFIEVDLGFKTFVISAGVLPYPITFLITDLLSEIYGKKRTNRVVVSGFIASAFVLGVLWLGMQFDSIEGSPVSGCEYSKVFGNSWRVVMASMIAYLAAQLVDVRVYHFWKDLTKGKHLWLRNNGSTIFSQLIDTSLVVGVLFVGANTFGLEPDTVVVIDECGQEITDSSLPLGTIGGYILDGWLFKSLCAFIDTPLIYLSTYWLRKHFGLKFGEEIPD